MGGGGLADGEMQEHSRGRVTCRWRDVLGIYQIAQTKLFESINKGIVDNESRFNGKKNTFVNMSSQKSRILLKY